ncbi:metallophosphoesterase family protein [Lachnoclostridium sp. Marseille-P6806]|uniref:metallophosphoesterase family protein n=1 Tax=Lachnoclostridium sp. Marseille-P6806 TaxID=2364793 RepID=UPI0010325860|nr:metallophosphoesterase [Lachnoclostridium sp. Marseille-P6806]
MKILAIADEESKPLWDYYNPERVKDVDLIISCGDLDPAYLEFLVTMTNCPLLYVHGNHDTKYDYKPPLGCTCIEDRVYNFRGLRILGLGGSIRYNDSKYMCTEKQMQSRINRLRTEITLKNGFDILVAHAPVKGYGDMDDIPHRGFDCFNDLLTRYRPKYMLHGHVHQTYSRNFVRSINHPSGTSIINCYESFILDIGADEYPAPGKTGSALYDLYMNMKRRREL